MTTWLAGMEITADRLADGLTPVVVTSGLTAASGFTVSSFSGRRIGHVAEIYAIVVNANAITGGNLSPDVAVATLPDGWEPADQINDVFGNGVTFGEFVIVSGEIRLRTVADNISAGTSIRLATSYVLEI